MEPAGLPEQRALRRTAELVARGVAEDELCAAVAAEASALLGVPVEVRRTAAGDGQAPHGARVAVDGVEWGRVVALAQAPAGTAALLGQFADLVAAAVANSRARAELRALVDEQAALRRVAELAAQDAPVPKVLEALANEASWLAGVDFTSVLRFDPDGSTEIVALSGSPPGLAVGMRAPNSGDGAVPRVWATGRAARADQLRDMSSRWAKVASGFGFTSSAAAPIRINGELWGVLVAVARDRPFPTGIEERLSNFTDIAGMAIAAVEVRRDLRALAEDQAALRRVAEMVARGSPLDDVFEAVASEAATLLATGNATLTRYVDERTSITVAACNSPVPVGYEVATDVDSTVGIVWQTGRATRIHTFEGTAMQQPARAMGITSAVAVPVLVEGRLWGALGSVSGAEPAPAGTEERLAQFAELAAAAIANAENKANLTASRARVVAAADETRRRLQRDVHDSAQQRLVHTIVTLKLARDALADGRDVAHFIDEALRNAERANHDLRDVVRGILPAALTRGGLAAGLETLVDDLAVPVDLDVRAPRLPAPLETTAYFVVAEALTNVVKHADATTVTVRVEIADDHLVLVVADDGRGGADATGGTGLTGLRDRVEARDGRLTVTSPAGEGTTVRVELPVSGPPPA